MEFNSKEPIFITIKKNFANLIEKGALKEGDEMPSVREVAVMNGVNPNTVQRAFSGLVEEGYLVSVPKKGFFVNKNGGWGDNRETLLEEKIQSILDSGYTKEEIINVLEGVHSNDRD